MIQSEDEDGCVGENLRTKNLVVPLVIVADANCKAPYCESFYLSLLKHS